MRAPISALLFSLCLPLAAWAGADLEKAEQLTAEMKYGQALKMAAKVLKSIDSGPEDLAKAYRIRGLCFSAQGRKRSARRAFDRLLAIDPEHQLSKRVSPKLRQPFDAAQAAAEGKPAISLKHEVPPVPEGLTGLELRIHLDGDRLRMVKVLRLRYQLGEDQAREHRWPVKKESAFSFALPEAGDAAEVTYHFEALNRHGGVLARSGKADEPFKLLSKVGVALAQKREADRKAAEEKRQAEARAAEALATAKAKAEEKKKDDDESGVWYTSWWFWTGVGVVVAGTATGVAIAATSSGGGGELEYNVVLR